MSNLIPEKRMDRNGKLVTRHVSAGSKQARTGMIPTLSSGNTDTRYTCTECRGVFHRGLAHRCLVPGLIQPSAAAGIVLEACRTIGGIPVFVGGCVRDALLAKNGKASHSKDIDVEVYGVDDPMVLFAALSDVGEVSTEGVRFGVFKTVVNGEEFDVSIPRREVKTGDKHRDFRILVDGSLDEVTAFSRRDYTVNAMGFDPETEELIDPYGGTADLSSGVLRHLSPSFVDDPLRVLRGMQFAARFGLVFSPETAELARATRDGFEHLSADKAWVQFQKMFTLGTSISHGLAALHDCGWEENLPELAAIRDIPQSPVWHPEGAVHVHSALSGDAAVRIAERDGLDEESRLLAVLAATVHDFGKAEHTQCDHEGNITAFGHDHGGVAPVRSFLNRIGAPDVLAEKVLPLVREHMCAHAIDGPPSPNAVKRMMRRLAGEDGNGPTIHDWARVVEADISGRNVGDSKGDVDAWLEVAERVKNTMKPILRGSHLIAAGLKPSPDFGVIIKEAIAAQDLGEFNDEAGAVAWLRKMIAEKQGK